MAFFEWKPEYNTHIKIIDEQHKKLVGYINQLYEAMSQGKTREILGPLIDELHDYTVSHFSDEERLMEKYNYNLITGHKLKHVEFTNKIKEYKQKFESGSTLMTVDMGKYLKDWLANHILVTDMKYVSFFKEKGVK